jgi:hypothetical protein
LDGGDDHGIDAERAESFGDNVGVAFLRLFGDLIIGVGEA